MNKWIGSGKVSEDPNIKYDGDKASFIAFTIMVKRNRRIKEGDQPVDFIDCICTGHNDRIAEAYLRKGKKVEVCGPLQSGHYTNKEGRKIYTKTVYAEEIIFAETKAEEEERQEKERQSQEPEPAPPDYNFMDIPDGIDGELPFC